MLAYMRICVFSYPGDVRDSFLISYSGEYSTSGVPLACQGIVDIQMSQCRKEWDCKCQDVANNTYLCIRKLNERENSILCEFDDDEKFVEAYNLNEDPYQLANLAFGDGKHKAIRSNWIASSIEEMRKFIKYSVKEHRNVYDKNAYTAMLRYLKNLWRKLITNSND